MFHDSNPDRFNPETVDAQIEQPDNQQLAEALHIIHKPAMRAEDRASLRRVQQQLRARSTQETLAVQPLTESPGKLSTFPSRRKRSVSPALASLVAVLLLGVLVSLLVVRTNISSLPGAPKTVVTGPNEIYALSVNKLTKMNSKSGAVIWQQAVVYSGKEYHPYHVLSVYAGAVYAVFLADIYVLDAATGRINWHIHTPSSQMTPVYTVADGTSLYVHYQDGTFAAYATRNGALQWHTTDFHTTPNSQWPDEYLFQVEHGNIYTNPVYNDQQYIYTLASDTGKVRWSRPSPAPSKRDMISLSVSTHGRLYYVIQDTIYAFDGATGTPLWQQRSLGAALITKLFVINGIVYADTYPVAMKAPTRNLELVYAFDATSGKLLWKTSGGYQLLAEANRGPLESSLSLPSYNGYLFVNANLDKKHSIQALNMKDGKVAWNASVTMLPQDIQASIADHTLSLSGSDLAKPRQFVSMDAQTGQVLAAYTPVLPRKYNIEFSVPFGTDAQHTYLTFGVGLGGGSLASVSLVDGSITWQKQLKVPDRFFEVVMAP